jgi:4-alpha-glucanotransferase
MAPQPVLEVSRPALRALAERCGILAEYQAAGSGERRKTSDATREALLAAVGFDASSEVAARAALATLAEREERRLLEPACVVEEGSRQAGRVAVLPAPNAEGRVSWSLELRTEDGEVLRRQGKQRSRPGRALTLALPAPTPPGYHTLRVVLESAAGRTEATQSRIVVPPACVSPAERLGDRRGFGLLANLYSVRSARNWGAGDLGDLAQLVRLAAAEGGDFVGVNPLHALWNRDGDVSPYLPLSRLYRNPLYLDVEAVPELASSEEARSRLHAPGFAAALAALRAGERIDYRGVAAAKRAVLAACHRTFAALHREPATPRGRAYQRWLAAEGEPLEDFASFVALSEHLGVPAGEGEPGDGPVPARDWRRWPEPYRDSRGPAVTRFRRDHAEAVDFQRWLQFELDRQLGAVAAEARRRDLGVGLFTDLALGSAAGGSDSWSFGDVFAGGARAGAPPDDFAPLGQDWGFPPLDPHRLRESGYAYWIRLLRAGFAHAGALRIDHILALSRLYWIPAGRPASEGAYVRYPERELLGILALESRRAGALAIGEDLGTVPPGLRPRLARRGVLSSQVLYFQRHGGDGRFVPARRYSARALVSANTHDLPTLAGFFDDRDLALRRRRGQLPDDEALARAQAEREHARRALLRRLVAEGRLADVEPEPTSESLGAAVTGFLCATPAPLVGLALDDLAAETEPVNLPGVGPERHPSWTRRMGVSLDELPAHPVARASLDAIPKARRRG